MPVKPAVLSIAGFDPTSGAGILADAMAIRTMGCHPLTVLTSVAAQGSTGVREVHTLPALLIRRELELIFEEFQPAAIKIGMLYSAEATEIVAEFLEKLSLPVVLDPVMQASSGGQLITSSALPLLENRLIPHCQVITPNLDEAKHFLGWSIRNVEDAKKGAKELSQRWGRAVLIKGGHMLDVPTDILVADDVCESFKHTRLAEGVNVRGTGCALSTAIAAGLGLGRPLREAVYEGISFVRAAIHDSYSAGKSQKIRFLEYPEQVPSG